MNIVHHGNAVSMSSREIAELVRSRHDSVKRTIERLTETGVITSPPLVEKPTAGRPVMEYVFSGEKGKRDSIVVVAQLSPEFTARLVDRWQELERQLSQPRELSRMDLILLAMDSEKARLEAEKERDHAIATKALIGSKREATAMATASAAKREASRLSQELGRGAQHATIAAVEKAIGKDFGCQGYRPLKKWCADMNVTPCKVQCPRFGHVKSWPAEAWMYVYGIDLGELFGAEAQA